MASDNNRPRATFEKSAEKSDREATALRALEEKHRQQGQASMGTAQEAHHYRAMTVAGYMAKGREFERDMTVAYGQSGRFDLVRDEPFIGFDPTTDGAPQRKLDLHVKNRANNQHMLVEFKRGHRAYQKDFAQMDTLDLNVEMDAQNYPNTPTRTVRYHFQANHANIDQRFINSLKQMDKNPKINVRARSGSMTSSLDHDVPIGNFHQQNARHPG